MASAMDRTASGLFWAVTMNILLLPMTALRTAGVFKAAYCWKRETAKQLYFRNWL